MEFLLLILIIIIILGVLFYLFEDKISTFLQGLQLGDQQKSPLKKKGYFPFKRKDFLLNVPERRFFEGLKQITPIDYVVYPQVLLSRIVYVSSSRREFWKHQNKINRKTVDFVIFEKQYLKPFIAIEYDGKTHNREDRQERDSFVDNVLNVAGIKILHIKHQENINFEEIKKSLNFK